jgi:hypothetical protein
MYDEIRRLKLDREPFGSLERVESCWRRRRPDTRRRRKAEWKRQQYQTASGGCLTCQLVQKRSSRISSGSSGGDRCSRIRSCNSMEYCIQIRARRSLSSSKTASACSGDQFDLSGSRARGRYPMACVQGSSSLFLRTVGSASFCAQFGPLTRLLHPIGLALDHNDFCPMHQSVNKGDDASRVRKHLMPFSEWSVCGHDCRRDTVPPADEFERLCHVAEVVA